MKRLLIANRGEIAVRVARTAREMGLETIAVYAESDAGAYHTRQMDRAVSLGAGAPAETYLSIPRSRRRATQSDAIHPGYGFLSESAEFARGDPGRADMGRAPGRAIEEMGGASRAGADGGGRRPGHVGPGRASRTTRS
jgi:acetyl/propionyl-CoA carboxylase alpha subunit